MEIKKEVEISLAQKKIIQSILYPKYIILSESFSFGRIYTTVESLKNWVYTGLEGAIIVGLEIETKISKFFLFDLDSFEILFECEIYKKLPPDNFKKGNERFYYFQIDKGFIGFEIPKIAEGEILRSVILNLTDKSINSKINKDSNIYSDLIFKEVVKKAINMFNKKLNEDNKPKNNTPDKLIINEGELKRYIDSVDLDEKNGKIIIKGNGIGGIDEVLKKMKGDLISIDNSLKIGNRDIFEEQISNNILNSYQRGILIPKRKINREGEPVIVEPQKNIKQPQSSNTNHIPEVQPINQSNNQKVPEVPSSNSNIPKPPPLQVNSNIPQPPQINPNNIQPPTNNIQPLKPTTNIPQAPKIPTNIPEPPKNIPQAPKIPTNIPEPPKNIPQAPKIPTNIPEPPKNIPQAPNVPKAPPIPVVVSSGKGKVPQAPPIPKAPPIPVNNTNVVKQPPPQQKKNTGKPLSLAEELAKKKNALKKVEMKEYVSPALKKNDENSGNDSGSSGGGMRGELMRAMKFRQNPKPQLNNNQNKNITQNPTTNNIQGKLPINQPKVEPPKVEPPKPKIETTQPKVEPPKTKVEPPKVEPPKPKVEPPKTKVEPPKNKVEPPKTKVEPPKTKVEPPKTNQESSKKNNSNTSQTMKFGNSGGFAAMRNMLANRMAPPSQKPKEPPKPIIEVASSSNTAKMDIKALISGMSKKMEGGSSGTTTTTPVVVSGPVVTPTVVGGKGPGIPPPPIPLTSGTVPKPPSTVPVPKAPTTVPVPKAPTTVPVPKAPTTVPVPKPPSTVPVPKPPSTVPVPKPPSTVPVPKPPSTVPVPKPPSTVPVPTMTGGKVPLPPPIPKAPPIPMAPKTTVTQVKAPAKAPPAKKQLSMAEEMAKLKLKKVETKEKFGLNAQKQSNSSSGGGSNTSSSGGNSFFAQLTSVKLKKINK